MATTTERVPRIGGKSRSKAAPPPFRNGLRRSEEISLPPHRRLRAFAFDPTLNLQIDAAVMNAVTLQVHWETDAATVRSSLKPGPIGEYIEVIDHDPASDCFYTPVDLDRPELLAQDGCAPSEGNPQFHQQMVYGVAMTTIEHFERALGRVALWAPRLRDTQDNFLPHKDRFVRRLRVYPHAIRGANAYYSPEKKALLFGYFPAARTGDYILPGGIVFTCLSHDIIAHETTHALLDGIHRRFIEPSNPDVLAFHEGFADIVALFQHFTYADALKHQIARTKGDLGRQNLLGELAQQFGQATGRYGALRSAIGEIDPQTKKWKAKDPDPAAYSKALEPHDRGAILVAAVFDAFLSIYRSRIADLLRIATNGTGVLAPGELHPDLVNRLASEASKSARHVLTMCIRALDYCPPVDVTFAEYLRALITADYDLVTDDDRGYRIAMIEAFRRRGIYPREVKTLGEDSLRWQTPIKDLPGLEDVAKAITLRWDLSNDRRSAFHSQIDNGSRLHEWLTNKARLNDEQAEQLGIKLHAQSPVEIHAARPARRLGPDGQHFTELVVEITQKEKVQIDARDSDAGTMTFRGGCTLLIDLEAKAIRYCIAKNIRSERRLAMQREFYSSPYDLSLQATYFGDMRMRTVAEPFAMLHDGGL